MALASAPTPLPSEPRPYYVPKLTYRNAVPSGTLPPHKLSTSTANSSGTGTSSTAASAPATNTSTKGDAITSSSGKDSPTLPEFSPAIYMPKTTSFQYATPSPLSVNFQPNRKRASFFGGLFAKEATAAALDQVAQQLVANHGELSAKAVPGVSSARMPEHVPKVNSKWDGVPESVKQKEKTVRQWQAKEKQAREQQSKDARGRRRQSWHSTRSQSADRAKPSRKNGGKVSSGRPGSSSTMSSFGSQSGMSEAYRTHFYNFSSSSASESLSASEDGTSLPEITSFFPNDIPSPPTIPPKFKFGAIPGTFSSQAPQILALPDHSSSPTTSPANASPVTPAPEIPLNSTSLQVAADTIVTTVIHSKMEQVVLVAAGLNVLGVPAAAKITSKPSLEPKRLLASKPPGDPFLAGEAHPLELPETPTESVIARYSYIIPKMDI